MATRNAGKRKRHDDNDEGKEDAVSTVSGRADSDDDADNANGESTISGSATRAASAPPVSVVTAEKSTDPSDITAGSCHAITRVECVKKPHNMKKVKR